jgi:predicted nuclease with TOPRIM domain
MKQRLEEFIQVKKEAFDTDEPSATLWAKIEKKMVDQSSKSKIFHLFNFRLVAAAIVTIAIGISIYMILDNKRLQEDLTAVQNSKDEHSRKATYNQQINEFTKTVATKQDQVSRIKNKYPHLYNEFTTDLKELHSAYNELKEELKNAPGEEILLDAMIQNLGLQAELLNEQLLIIQQLKQSKQFKNGKATPII